MAFKILRNLPSGLLLKYASTASIKGPPIIALFDRRMEHREEKLLENLLKITGEVYLVAPETENSPQIESETVTELAGLCDASCVFIVSGSFAPVMIREYANFRNALKVVFINPSYDPGNSTLMSSFETPCLVITGTPGNLDHDPDAVKYHDLISGSRIQYVRGVEGNPLFMKFTQSFNSIQRFISDE